MCSRIDGVVLAPHVIGGVMHLHGLDGVDCVVRNDNRVALFVCEGVVAITDV